MATDAELLAAIKAEALKTSITPDEWLRRVRTGSYAYRGSHWYHVLQLAQQLKPHVPPPVPPPAGGHPQRAVAQYMMFCDTEPLLILGAPAKYKLLLSADPAFRDQATAAVVAKVRAAGHGVYSWCDCESTLPPAAIELYKELQLDGWVGQAENQNQYSNMSAVWRPAPVAVVGNLNELDGWQVDEIRRYVSPPFIQEDFWNEGWARQPKEPAIAAYCNGQYSALWNPTVQQLRAAGRWAEGDGCFKVAGVQGWEALP